MSGSIVVTGASGRTGRACVEKLVAAGARVRVFVRRTEAAQELERLGAAESFVGDLFNADDQRAAMRGASRVLHICPPMHPQEDSLAQSMIAVATEAGVGQFVLWSVLHPHADVPHHRRKQRAEEMLVQSDIPFTILQPGRYMQHLESVWTKAREGHHAFPFSTKVRFSLAHVDDLAHAAAIVLTAGGHENAIYELAGPEALSQEDCARVIGEEIGRPVEAAVASLDDFLARMKNAGAPDWRVETLRVMNLHYDQHGLAGNGNVLRWLLGRSPMTFRDYVREMMSR